MTLPLRALADCRAGVSLRHGADRESDERKQRACYHLHAGEMLAVSVASQNIPSLTSVFPRGRLGFLTSTITNTHIQSV